MNRTDLLLKQTENAYEWLNKLITSVPKNKWEQIPNGIESNITWQTGHLILSIHYHSIMTTIGFQMDILKQIPMREYAELFTNAHPTQSVGKADPKELEDQLRLIQEKSLDVIGSLSDKDLTHSVEPTKMPHPIAKTKLDAIDWNIKHTMWHCGQLGMIKRAVDKRYDFGLQKPS